MKRRFALTVAERAAIMGFYIVVLVLFVFWDDGVAFRGVEPAVISGEIDYRAMSRWLLMMTAPLLTDGYLLICSHQIRLFACLRLGALLLMTTAPEALQMAALLGLNDVLWLMLLIVFYILTKGASAFDLLEIFAMGGTFLLGEFAPGIRRWMPCTWSMLCRTNGFFQDGGSIVSYAVMSGGMALLLLGVVLYTDTLRSI
ncbi:MAG: hypothetical protein LUH36_05020 [Oscillospiraceae bacterium]|nr:hypothetical protein [Oscillospiraceae bacterium]